MGQQDLLQTTILFTLN